VIFTAKLTLLPTGKETIAECVRDFLQRGLRKVEAQSAVTNWASNLPVTLPGRTNAAIVAKRKSSANSFLRAGLFTLLQIVSCVFFACNSRVFLRKVANERPFFVFALANQQPLTL